VMIDGDRIIRRQFDRRRRRHVICATETGNRSHRANTERRQRRKPATARRLHIAVAAPTRGRTKLLDGKPGQRMGRRDPRYAAAIPASRRRGLAARRQTHDPTPHKVAQKHGTA